MNSVSPIHSLGKSTQATMSRTVADTFDHGQVDHSQKGDTKEKFQDFVAGTFYKEMLKSLHKMHGKPSYMYGGQAEKIFQSQLNQQVAEDLAKSHGGQMTDSLFEAFIHNRRG